MIPRRQLSCLLASALLVQPLTSQTSGQEDASRNAPPKVFVVPMKGPLHYRMAAAEMGKIVRSAMVQKPEALVLMISSPGGDRQIAFEIAQQIADLGLPNTAAYVSGDYGGAFGSAVFPLLTCQRVFVDPASDIDLRSPVQDPRNAAADGTPLTAHEVSLLQTWVAQAHQPWTPIQQWLSDGRLLGAAPSQALSPSRPAAMGAAASEPASRSIPGLKPLGAEPAADLKEVLQRLGVSSANVITWPDPIERSNQAMQKTFQLADGLVKAANSAIAAAREADPRAHRYELQDVTRESSVGTFVLPPHSDVGTEYRTTDRVTGHDLFSDGGVSWRAYTDRCMSLVREAMATNRRLAALIARYPELGLEPKELNDSHATLSAWLNQLRIERGLRSPPGSP